MSVPDLPPPEPGEPACPGGDEAATAPDGAVPAPGPVERHEADQADVDAAFAALVAGWDGPVAERGPTPPVVGHAPPRRIPPARPAAADQPPAEQVAPEQVVPEQDLDEDEGHYEPLDPPAVPRPSAQALGGLLLILGGVALLVAPGVIGLTDGTGLPLGMVAVAGGLAWLLSRLRAAPDPDSGWDDGARL